ncbi:hypothetical protein EAI30_09095 [Romboutsia ilealis]|uniref:Uncharacterized protein n=1 Tax=Romboutsia faecis TaxID=2764597 RepID=A0ABR7JS64_9FIRM|nr:hypothetical protein [Romboutsia faecis]MBC5997598.1 hypothetical protein [Romboutsia faecis]MRN24769.1 hypothetical protein [Romboutsia ilealis]
MYSKRKIVFMSVVALVVLTIGIFKEGVYGKNSLNQANNDIITTYVSAENASSTQASITQQPEHRHRGKEKFESTLKELQESGVLTEADVKKIEAYQKSQMEARKAEMKQKRNEEINNMVKENIITAEKAEKLKEALDKNFEK